MSDTTGTGGSQELVATSGHPAPKLPEALDAHNATLEDLVGTLNALIEHVRCIATGEMTALHKSALERLSSFLHLAN